MSAKLTLKERKREAIISAAVELFLQHGFQNTSMDTICAHAEVSKRTLYNHFSSKELLFQAIAQQMFEHCAEVTGISYQAEAALEKQLMAFADKEIALLQSEQFMRLARMMLAECIQSPELSAEAMAQMNDQEQGLETWIAQAQADGRLQSVDVSYAANQFIALIKAHAFWPQVLMGMPAPDDSLQQQIKEDAVLMFLARYKI